MTGHICLGTGARRSISRNECVNCLRIKNARLRAIVEQAVEDFDQDKDVYSSHEWRSVKAFREFVKEKNDAE